MGQTLGALEQQEHGGRAQCKNQRGERGINEGAFCGRRPGLRGGQKQFRGLTAMRAGHCFAGGRRREFNRAAAMAAFAAEIFDHCPGGDGPGGCARVRRRVEEILYRSGAPDKRLRAAGGWRRGPVVNKNSARTRGSGRSSEVG
jgi:hypothetical protein